MNIPLNSHCYIKKLTDISIKSLAVNTMDLLHDVNSRGFSMVLRNIDRIISDIGLSKFQYVIRYTLSLEYKL